MSIQMVCMWHRTFLKGRTNMHNEPHSGRPSTSTENPALVDAIKLIVSEEGYVTLDKILAGLPVEHQSGGLSVMSWDFETFLHGG